MIAAVVFSRDRAAQLDLLLRSLEWNGAGRFDPISVVWRATSDDYLRGYDAAAAEHPEAHFLREDGLSYQVRSLVRSAGEGALSFFADDDVVFRSVDGTPADFLEEEEVLCFSLRLGRNTTRCYPLRRDQRFPDPAVVDAGRVLWRWKGADGDFGYPGSIDGHVFRAADVERLVGNGNFSGPNWLEASLVREASALERPLMACYEESRLVSIPANRVNETQANRFGERYPFPTAELNERYLAGARLDLDAIDFATVDAAHVELPLVWREP